MFAHYYAVLEIDPSSDAPDWHGGTDPDRNPAPGVTLQFQDINEAHQLLSDPGARTTPNGTRKPASTARLRVR